MKGAERRRSSMCVPQIESLDHDFALKVRKELAKQCLSLAWQIVSTVEQVLFEAFF